MQLSYHALERLETRNLDEAQIAYAIKYGVTWRCPHDHDIHYARHEDVFVVTHRGDFVITAYYLEGNH